MKKLNLILVLISFASYNVVAQKSTDHFSQQNALKIDPFAFGRAEFQLSYERYFKERSSSLIVAPSLLLRESKDNSINGFQFMTQYRFYLTHLRKDLQQNFLGVYNYGFYAGVYALYFNYTEEYSQGYHDPTQESWVNGKFTKSAISGEGGALLGIQIDITKRIIIDFFVGGGVRKSNSEDSYEDLVDPEYYNNNVSVFDPGYTGVKPKVGLTVGITF